MNSSPVLAEGKPTAPSLQTRLEEKALPADKKLFLSFYSFDGGLFSLSFPKSYCSPAAASQRREWAPVVPETFSATYSIPIVDILGLPLLSTCKCALCAFIYFDAVISYSPKIAQVIKK